MNDSLNSLRTRVQKLHTASEPTGPKCILYIMSRDMRTQSNHALLAAQQQALKQKLPLIVAYVLYEKRVGNRAREHMQFLLDGLTDVAMNLKQKNIAFVLRFGQPEKTWQEFANEFSPAAIYFDFNSLRGPQRAQQTFATKTTVPVFVVDTHNVVPVWIASGKQEIGARTLRPKINHLLPEYVYDDAPIRIHPYSGEFSIPTESLKAASKRVLPLYPANGTNVSRFTPGEKAAGLAVEDFIAKRLRGYAAKRNDPSVSSLSELSPYLHYGHISSLQVALAAYDALKADSSLQADVETLIEEMVVRKELADNYCYYNPHYDSLKGAPAWAQTTLAKHTNDPREFIYSRKQFEAAETHDEAWNAAQLQLTGTGKIHGYMRMYWAKKILEWSKTPHEALQTTLYLNDFYSLDGGDPNGYVGILWSIAGLHDRPWGERPVYGVIRSMVYGGLKRKFDIQTYIDMFSNQTKLI